jgi:hypothetical protein
MTSENNDTAMKAYLREIGRTPLLTPRQEIELAGKIKEGDRKARALMISSNLRLVVTIAQDYANLGLPILDVISEGNIGLMIASTGSIHRKGQSSAPMRLGGSDNRSSVLSPIRARRSDCLFISATKSRRCVASRRR